MPKAKPTPKAADTQTAVFSEAVTYFKHCQYAKAEPLFLSAAAVNPRAMYFLGEIYSQGTKPQWPDKTKGAAWYEKGAQAGDLLCQFNLVQIQDLPPKTLQKKPRSLFPGMAKLAQKGDIFAAYELGCLFLYNWEEN